MRTGDIIGLPNPLPAHIPYALSAMLRLEANNTLEDLCLVKAQAILKTVC